MNKLRSRKGSSSFATIFYIGLIAAFIGSMGVSNIIESIKKIINFATYDIENNLLFSAALSVLALVITHLINITINHKK